MRLVSRSHPLLQSALTSQSLLSSVHKSSEEKKELKKTHAQRTAEKAARKKEQEANVARKKEAAAALKTSKRGQKRDGAAAGADDEAAAEGEDDEDAFVHDYTVRCSPARSLEMVWRLTFSPPPRAMRSLTLRTACSRTRRGARTSPPGRRWRR